ncbi:MAG: alpha/beta hydrolase [Candidatus Binatia bacterium]
MTTTTDDAARFLAAPLETVDTGTARVAYRRFGNGPALLLVHGFPLSGFTWRKVIPALAARYTCYAPDVPGMGESTWTDATDFSFPGQGRTLKAFVDALGLGRYSLMAHDTGGTFARFCALEDPSRVDKVILINTEMPGHRPPWIPLYQVLMGVPGTLTVFGALLRSSAFLRSPMGFGGCFGDRDLIDGEFHEQFVQPLIRSDLRKEGMQRYLRGATWQPVDALARDHARLTMPVQLIWGADDPTFPIGLARAMVMQFPDARLAAVTGGRLLVHEERPAEVARLALAFLG